MAVPASAQALPQRILDRLKMHQNSMLSSSDKADHQSNTSKEIDDQPIAFPPIQPISFTALNTAQQNDTKSSSKGSKSVNNILNKINNGSHLNESDSINLQVKPNKPSSSSLSVESTKQPSKKPDKDSFESTKQASIKSKENSIESTKRPSTKSDDKSIESTKQPSLKMDDNSLNRLWQVAIKNFTVRPDTFNESQNRSKNITKVELNINRNNGSEIELGGHDIGPNVSVNEIEEMEEPKKFALFGLSNQIVANLKFDQIELDSQMIMVHDIDDPDIGQSPVDYCPIDARK